MTRMFILLLFGHALADFPLQQDFLAKGKNRHLCSSFHIGVIWPWCLTWHSLIHAGSVLLITRKMPLAILEFILHWIIDFAKCENWTDFHVDQSLHIFCKVIWMLLS